MPWKKITTYTKDYCPYCHKAKALLQELGVPFTDIDVTHDEETYRTVKMRSGLNTVPQIFAGDTCLGGFSDIDALHKMGKLLPALQQKA